MPAILIIFGITGDLAKKKLLPALGALKAAGKLPAQFELVGVSRKASTDFFQMDLDNAAEYVRLAEHLAKLEDKFGMEAERLYYLAVPPANANHILAHLGEVELLERASDKVLLEKPFGTDLASSEAGIARVATYAGEEQVYRVDHYLAKALADRLLAARRGRVWNKDTVKRIAIVMTEAIGIEGRASFYEQVGVLGDVIQNHGMALLALAIMELPEDPEEEPGARAAALAQLAPVALEKAVRGQYQGYREEAVNKESVVPTYASLTLNSEDPAWAGVPFTITAGKGLDAKRTELRVTFASGEVLVIAGEPESALGGYSQMLLSAMEAKHERFVSSSEALAAWHALDALAQAWRASGEGLYIYERGSSPLQLSAAIQDGLSS